MQLSVFLGRSPDFVNALDEDIRHAKFIKIIVALQPAIDIIT
jgi:hypothetical protein